MINKQAPEKKASGDGNQLEVHSVFYTIQGEGPYSGKPALFIRLAGCNLICPGCDTEYTQGREARALGDLLLEVKNKTPLYRKFPLVVITGGEPFRQNITPLVCHLISQGFTVQIETNGTFAPSQGFPSGATIVCSPKGGKVADGLIRFVAAYKYVLDASSVSERDGLPTSVLGTEISPARPPLGYTGSVYVSPMDTGDEDQNRLNMQVASAMCMKYGYTLNLQIHKIVGLP